MPVVLELVEPVPVALVLEVLDLSVHLDPLVHQARSLEGLAQGQFLEEESAYLPAEQGPVQFLGR